MLFNEGFGVAEKMDYYMTIVFPDGRTMGPTRLTSVHSDSAANRVIKQERKSRPDCQVMLSVSPE